MNEEKIKRLQARYKEVIEEICTQNTDVPIVFISKENIINFLTSLKIEEGFEFNFLSDLTAYDHNPPIDKIIDYGLGRVTAFDNEPRFMVVYQLLSMQNKERLRVKVRLRENEEVPTVTSIWEAANWLEREVYDLFGIHFSGHPNLRRIMLDDRWVGHPFRKDYPIKKYQRFPDAAKIEGFELE